MRREIDLRQFRKPLPTQATIAASGRGPGNRHTDVSGGLRGPATGGGSGGPHGDLAVVDQFQHPAPARLEPFAEHP